MRTLTVALMLFLVGVTTSFAACPADGYKIIIMDPINPIYVDDDAPNDPGPRDATLSDPKENGTQAHPYDSIQEAIDLALDGDQIVVLPGRYEENIDFKGLSIEVAGVSEPSNRAFPVIDGKGQGPVVSFASGEQADSVLRGCVLTGGAGELAGGISIVGSSPTIQNCVIAGNRSAHPSGAALYCVGSDSYFENCTVADNVGVGAAMVFEACRAVVYNSIIWNDTPNQIRTLSGIPPIVVHSNVKGAWPGFGNINVGPGFAVPGFWADPWHTIWVNGDYHLMSTAGRWNTDMQAWVKDAYSSLCIDAGDPIFPWKNEPAPNGGQINLGAYGGTTQASKSWGLCSLMIFSSQGGTVTAPGEGLFAYDCGTKVALKAQSGKSHRFIKWQGTAVDAGKVSEPDKAITTVTVDGDYSLKAIFDVFIHIPVDPDPTIQIPEVSTYIAKQITSTSAVFRGCIVDDGGQPCQYRFVYKTETGPEVMTEWQGEFVGGDIIHLRVLTLLPDTTYYYKLQVRNKAGVSPQGYPIKGSTKGQFRTLL